MPSPNPSRKREGDLIRLSTSDADFGRDFTAAEFRDQLDNGRKVAILILEFFDRHGVTVRRGDLRRVVPQKLEQYGPPPAT